MSEIVGKEVITREKGYLYCVSKDGKVDRIPTKYNTSGTRKTVGTEQVKKEDGYLYFLGKDGKIARTPKRNRAAKSA